MFGLKIKNELKATQSYEFCFKGNLPSFLDKIREIFIKIIFFQISAF